MAPLVTVVTPSFNYARYLGDCLASVRAQTWPRLEHLVLDACSTDGTPEVVRPFLGTYPLQVFFEKDQGQADAINRGFSRARGEVLCWLNADDYWLHERVVEEAVAALDSGADVVTSGGCYVDAEKKPISRVRLADPARVLPELRYHDTILQPATFWRRSVHQKLNTGLHYAFDWRLWLDLRRAGARFQVLDREWAAYRLHEVNKTSADPAKRKWEIAGVLEGEFGRASAQWLWAQAVAAGYGAAERLDAPWFKRAVRRANVLMGLITRRTVYSC